MGKITLFVLLALSANVTKADELTDIVGSYKGVFSFTPSAASGLAPFVDQATCRIHRGNGNQSLVSCKLQHGERLQGTASSESQGVILSFPASEWNKVLRKEFQKYEKGTEYSALITESVNFTVPPLCKHSNGLQASANIRLAFQLPKALSNELKPLHALNAEQEISQDNLALAELSAGMSKMVSSNKNSMIDYLESILGN